MEWEYDGFVPKDYWNGLPWDGRPCDACSTKDHLPLRLARLWKTLKAWLHYEGVSLRHHYWQLRQDDRGRFSHAPCVHCGNLTHARSAQVHSESLRRLLAPVCYACSFSHNGADPHVRERRARYDWTRPIPDQYAGLSRTTIREFLESPELERVLGNSADPTVAGMLNNSISTLGMHKHVYAELRDGQVVLRRLQDGKVPQ